MIVSLNLILLAQRLRKDMIIYPVVNVNTVNHAGPAHLQAKSLKAVNINSLNE